MFSFLQRRRGIRAAECGQTGRTAAQYVVCDDVKASYHNDGVIFLHLTRGDVLTGNRMAAAIWQAICNGESLEKLAADTSAGTQAPVEQIRSDIDSFLYMLRANGMVSARMEAN